jgi:hypothetical protein
LLDTELSRVAGDQVNVDVEPVVAKASSEAVVLPFAQFPIGRVGL